MTTPQIDTDTVEKSDAPQVSKPEIQRLRYLTGWLFVRPRRWLFSGMICVGRPRWWFSRSDWNDGWEWPNIHWWIGNRFILPFFKWLNWDAWRPLCDWTGGRRNTFPWIARVIMRIGQTTYGCAAHGGECYHCGSEDGDPVNLSDDDTGTTFKLLDCGSNSTPDGTNHWFSGITICPRCGYQHEYNDGSL